MTMHAGLVVAHCVVTAVLRQCQEEPLSLVTSIFEGCLRHEVLKRGNQRHSALLEPFHCLSLHIAVCEPLRRSPMLGLCFLAYSVPVSASLPTTVSASVSLPKNVPVSIFLSEKVPVSVPSSVTLPLSVPVSVSVSFFL